VGRLRALVAQWRWVQVTLTLGSQPLQQIRRRMTVARGGDFESKERTAFKEDGGSGLPETAEVRGSIRRNTSY